MLPAIGIDGINALPCGIKAEPTVDEVNYQAYSLAGSIYAPDYKEKCIKLTTLAFMLRIIEKNVLS